MSVRQAAVCLLLSVGCATSTAGDGAEGLPADVGENSQGLFSRDSFYQLLYDRFDGKYEVDTFTDTIERTGGLAGDAVDADFYFPDGCRDGWKSRLWRKIHDRDNEWSDCYDLREHLGQRRVSREDYADSFPVVAVLQGGNVAREQYSEFATELASYGYVVVVPDLKQPFGPPGSPELFVTSQWVANWIETDVAQQHADTRSPLHRIADASSMGVLGHSFGGAAALAVVQGTCEPPFCVGPPSAYLRPASVKVAIAHGFQNCDSAGACFYPDTSATPTMIVNGALDDQNAPADEAYVNLAPSRALVVLDDVNHFGLTNDDLASPTGLNTEPNELDQKTSIHRSARWTAIWLGTHLLGDSRATKLVFESGGVEGATVTSEM